MKRVTLLCLLAALRTSFSQGSESCENEPLCESTDGPHDLECYYVGEIENGLNCSWTPGSHHTNATAYTLNISWLSRKARNDVKSVITTSTYYTIQRKNLYISENATIWVETTDQKNMSQRTRSITLIPKESERPKTPLNISYKRMTGQLHLKYDFSEKLQYELNYRKPGTANWHLVDLTLYITPLELEQLAAYEFRMRCTYVSKVSLWSLWSDIYHVPPELVDMPLIHTPVTELLHNDGKRIITIQWENPVTAINATVLGYSISIARILANKINVNQTFDTVNKECTFILSQGPFKFRVKAFNSAGSSPANEIAIPPFNQLNLNNKINATPHGNNSILISWHSEWNELPKGYIVDWGPIIGNETRIEHSEKIKKQRSTYNLKGIFQPKQRYRIMLHRKTEKWKNVNNTEITVGMVDVYALEGTPRSGPNNIMVTNISKTSAMIRWDRIPEDECQGFLQGYKIFCYLNKASETNTFIPISVNSSTTHYMLTGLLQKTVYAVQISGFTKAGEGSRSEAVSFATKEFDDGELHKIAAVVSIAIIVFVFLVAGSCLFLIRRTKKMFWPSIPNPGNSLAIQIIGRGSSLPYLDNELLNLKANSPLVGTEEELESLHTIEEVTSTLTDYGLQENEQYNATDQEPGSDLHDKPTVIQITDYTTMENFRQIMPTITSSDTVIQANRSEQECNDQQSDSLIQTYMKQHVGQMTIQRAEDNPLGTLATSDPELVKNLDQVKVAQNLHFQLLLETNY
ncbi:interleukin-6 receptor subunit beta [Scyliorhinus torazame]|uniref:interleukin-6 receptor subunit beta n=1 Tax=Scyliorhinus torazame TaxID=75743 RepID=UPI003B5920E8